MAEIERARSSGLTLLAKWAILRLGRKLQSNQGNRVVSTKAVKKKTTKILAAKKGALTDETLPDGLSREPNAESLEALAELEAGKLTRYIDTAEMFKRLGIKVGKA